MILLGTHVWIWWIQGEGNLSESALDALDQLAPDGIAISPISCWEVAMLHIQSRLRLPCSLDDWLNQALQYPGVRLTELSRAVLVDSCRLPGDFHKDPADRMIVAAAREADCPLVSADRKILAYPDVKSVHPNEVAKNLIH